MGCPDAAHKSACATPWREHSCTSDSAFTQLSPSSPGSMLPIRAWIAMFLAKELTSSSLPEIGRAFSGKHHTTVLHSIQKIDKLRQREPDLNSLIHNLIDSIH